MTIGRDYSSAFDNSGGSSGATVSSASAASAGGLVLHIGVIDIPYGRRAQSERVPKAKKGKRNKPIKQTVASGTQTTGDVAEWLEKKYGVMQAFVDHSMEDIAEALEESLTGAMDNLLMGAPAFGNPFASAGSEVSQLFKDFLESGRAEQVGIDAVPTEAAMKGVNHRLKSNRGPRRPSFIDTGLYQDSATSWIE